MLDRLWWFKADAVVVVVAGASNIVGAVIWVEYLLLLLWLLWNVFINSLSIWRQIGSHYVEFGFRFFRFDFPFNCEWADVWIAQSNHPWTSNETKHESVQTSISATVSTGEQRFSPRFDVDIKLQGRKCMNANFLRNVSASDWMWRGATGENSISNNDEHAILWLATYK